MLQHKALFLHGIGQEYIQGKMEIYMPGPGEILVKIRVATLNPMEWKIQKYEFDFIKFPIIAELDVAGDVIKIG
ncbi:hypothetical protein BDQ17DRAFT_1258278 [Cyathus striatus]|nr:hypothetical protein BDQ17DRAFT_1258278 [Cyathus striatus]